MIRRCGFERSRRHKVTLHEGQDQLLRPAKAPAGSGSGAVSNYTRVAWMAALGMTLAGAAKADAVREPTPDRPLLFLERHDLEDVRGDVRTTPGRFVRNEGIATPPGERVIGVFELGDGRYAVYGYTGLADERQTVTRSITRDFKTYESADVLALPKEGRWLLDKQMARRPDTGEYLLLAWARGDLGHSIKEFRSQDGVSWSPLRGGETLYLDHDAARVTWCEERSLYIQMQTTYQTWEKRYPDNVGRKNRRVLSVRTSPDGATWTPEIDVHPGSLNPRARRRRIYRADEELITPDADDPPDLEFYRAQPFRNGDRYVAAVLLYAPNPQVVNPNAPTTPHGPMVGTRRWFADDPTDVRGWRRLTAIQTLAHGTSSSITHRWFSKTSC